MYIYHLSGQSSRSLACPAPRAFAGAGAGAGEPRIGLYKTLFYFEAFVHESIILL